MYGTLTCSRCLKPYQPGHDSFCEACLKALATAGAAATEHQKALNRGDVNVVPESPEEHRKVRAAISKRLRDNGSIADSTAPMKRYNPRGKTHDQSNR